MENLTLYGEGGTDFRPAFSYVDQLIRDGEFEHLRGLLYFTDGYGIYPEKMRGIRPRLYLLRRKQKSGRYRRGQ